MNKKEISLLIIYAIWLQISPWHPSIYSCIIDFLMTAINDITLVVLYQYYQSIPESKTSFLHYIMRIIVVSLGLAFTVRMCGRCLINIAPEFTIELLYKLPSLICMLHEGYGFSHLTFSSIMILITIRSLFNAYPNLMFLFEDEHLTYVFWIVAVIHQIDGFVFFFLQSYSMCDTYTIKSFQLTLNLQIDESKIGTYEGVSIFGKFFLCMPLSAEIFSRLVMKYRNHQRKVSLRKNNKITPVRHLVDENEDVPNKVSSDLEAHTSSNEEGKTLTKENFFYKERKVTTSSCHGDNTTIKPAIFDALINQRKSAVQSQLSVVDVDTEMDIISVDSREFQDSLQQTNSEGDVDVVEPNKFVSHPIKPNDFNADNENHDNISLGLVGFNILLVLFLLISIGKIVTAIGLPGYYKDLIEYLITFFSFKLGRLIESMLPLYWLLRKKDTRKFAVRRLKYWKDLFIYKLFRY